MYKFNVFLFTIGILLQLIYSINADIVKTCGIEEEMNLNYCKSLFKTPAKDFRQSCCALFSIEKCIVNHVPEECKPILRERYDQDPLKKGQCRQFVNNCDHVLSNTILLTTPSTQTFNAKHENLKQSISPQTQNTQNTQAENNLVAEEIKNADNGFMVTKSNLIMVTCSLLMVNLVNRWWCFY